MPRRGGTVPEYLRFILSKIGLKACNGKFSENEAAHNPKRKIRRVVAGDLDECFTIESTCYTTDAANREKMETHCIVSCWLSGCRVNGLGCWHD